MEPPAPYGVMRLDEIEAIPVAGVRWKPVRRTLGIEAFGINAYTGDAGEHVVEEHDEQGGGAGGHEEVYAVITRPGHVHGRRRRDRRGARDARLRTRSGRTACGGRSR